MKVLILDNQDTTAEILRAKTQEAGHEVRVEASKDVFFDAAFPKDFDIAFIDPTPLTDAKQTIITCRRSAQNYLYTVLMGENTDIKTAISAGANAHLAKPFDPDAPIKCLQQGNTLLTLRKRLNDPSQDFPSAGGVIAKSAFNQLFLSTLERSDRYGEQSYALFIKIDNYQELLELDGAYVADFAAAKLSHHLGMLRRQSDIVGQTAKHEYALLLQHPKNESEPAQAAERFANSLSACTDIASGALSSVNINITLLCLPSGETKAAYDFTLKV